jgi:hypothetical protein
MLRRFDEIPSKEGQNKALEETANQYLEDNRLDEVPSKDDLEKISRSAQRRQSYQTNADHGQDIEYSFLEYAAQKEKDSRTNFLEQEITMPEAKVLQGTATAGAAALATMMTGDWQSAYLAGTGAYAATEITLRNAEHTKQEYTDRNQTLEKLREKLREQQ